MVDPDRRICSIIFACALAGTLVSALVLHSKLLVLLCLVVQIPAYIWYCASYIPFARDCILGCLRGIADKFRWWCVNVSFWDRLNITYGCMAYLHSFPTKSFLKISDVNLNIVGEYFIEQTHHHLFLLSVLLWISKNIDSFCVVYSWTLMSKGS
jgi:hypothetical protein